MKSGWRPGLAAPRLAPVVATALATLAASAGAAGPLGSDGSPIRTSSYGVDLAQTPVLAGARVTGLAGAYVALAEGTDGNIQTPVSPAVRTSYALDHFDYELSLGVTLPATLTSTDFFNTGRGKTQLSDANQQGFVFVTPALNLVWGKLGLGAIAELQDYTLARSSDAPANARTDRITAEFSIIHLQAAQTFGDGQLVVGGGARIINLDVTNDGAEEGKRGLFSTTGAGFEVGALLMPRRQPFRFGASFRSAVSTVPGAGSALTPDGSGDRVIGNPADPVNAFWLPGHVELPWDLNVGFAVSIGPRPFNVPFHDPKPLVDDARRTRKPRARERARLRETEQRGAPSTVRDGIDAELDAEDAIDQLYVDRVAQDARALLKRRESERPRRYLLVTTSLLLTGVVADAVGVESFLQRVVARSGQNVVYSPRLGLETEAVPRWLKLRTGTYGEPSRFATSGNRLHGTFGFDVKVFPWEVFGLFEEGTEWRVSGSVDAAPRYLGWGLSVGVWH